MARCGAFVVVRVPSVVLMLVRFLQDPGGHAALVLHDSGLDRVDELGVELCGELHEEWFRRRRSVRFRRVRGSGGRRCAGVSCRWWRRDGRRGDRRVSGRARGFAAWRGSVVVAGEVEDGVAEDDVEGGVGEGHGFDGFDAEVFGGKSGA